MQRTLAAFITVVRIGAPLEQKADDLELRIQRHVRDGLVVVVVVVVIFATFAAFTFDKAFKRRPPKKLFSFDDYLGF